MKMKTQQTSSGKNGILVSSELKRLFPKVLVDYLCKLLECDAAILGSWHIFRFKKSQLGGKDVQDILHIGENKVSLLHRIFGCEPLDTEIIVYRKGNEYEMKLAKENDSQSEISLAIFKEKTGFQSGYWMAAK